MLDFFGGASFLLTCGLCIVMRSRSRKKWIKNISGDSEQDYAAVVVLNLPLAGVEGMQTAFQNDLLLAEVIKTNVSTIYAFVDDSLLSNDARALKYISEVYTRLWDELICINKIGTKCFVVSNTLGCSFSKLEHILVLPGVKYLVVSDDSPETRAMRWLANNTNANVELLVKNIPTVFNKVFYYDADDERVVRFKRLAVGGTFDRLHNGHRKLLTLAAASCCDSGTLVVGITSDVMLRKKKLAKLIFAYEERKATIEEFLKIIKPDLKIEFFPLIDSFGPTTTDPSIEALVVSSETLSGILQINAIRETKGFDSLSALVVQRSNAATLSSTFIREQETKIL